MIMEQVIFLKNLVLVLVISRVKEIQFKLKHEESLILRSSGMKFQILNFQCLAMFLRSMMGLVETNLHLSSQRWHQTLDLIKFLTFKLVSNMISLLKHSTSTGMVKLLRLPLSLFVRSLKILHLQFGQL